MSAPTKRQIAAAQIRTLRTMRQRLLTMSAAWEDLDQFNMNQLEELADKVEEVSMGLVEQKDDAG